LRGLRVSSAAMAETTILVASDARWVRDQVRAAFVAPGQEVIEVERGQDVRGVVAEREPDLVILDMQIGNMGGIAVAIDLRLEESGGRLPHSTILILLDRPADRFLAARADADADLVKPVDAGMLRRTAKVLLERRASGTTRPDEPDASPGGDVGGDEGATDGTRGTAGAAAV
jgi:DNA-binding response OmpR family regulator